MARLYPPLIAGTIPAFTLDDSNSKYTIKVPFSMNRAVSKSDVEDMTMVLKSIPKNTFVCTIKSTSIDYDNNEATFVFSDSDLLNGYTMDPGTYFKLQICYNAKSSGILGYYSTVGVIKYVSTPTVTISSLESSTVNNFISSFVGNYDFSDCKNKTEKVYSYNFTIYDNDDNVYLTTGDKLHNSSGDDPSANIQSDSYNLYEIPNSTDVYYVQFTVTTLNGLVISSPKYALRNESFAPISESFDIVTECNTDEGYIDISLSSRESNGTTSYLTKNYRLLRASSVNDYSSWTVLTSICLYGNTTTTVSIYRDFLIEQGIGYRYAVEQYNEYGLFSEKQMANEIIYADFEDAFLYDGTRQLKIRYNPKISSFKTDLQEAKVDSIGGKYPYFFRNGYSEYKEFPIAGLISYLMDNGELFLTDEESEDAQLYINSKYRTETASIDENGSQERKMKNNYETDNIFSERYFKLKVLDWLNNGEPKLFKSPMEGNYLVRLLNVSLSPEDTLGRLLHTFNATAYEIGACDYETFKEYGFITDELKHPTVIAQASVYMKDYERTLGNWIQLLNYDGIGSVIGFNTQDFPFGTYLRVVFNSGNEDNYIITKDLEIFYDDETISEIYAYYQNLNTDEGILTYTISTNVETSSSDNFDLLKEVKVKTVVNQSFIFKDYSFEDYDEETSTQTIDINGEGYKISLLDILQNDSKYFNMDNTSLYKNEILDIYSVKVRRRPAYIAYYNSDDGCYYQKPIFDSDGILTGYEQKWDLNALYNVDPLARLVVNVDDSKSWKYVPLYSINSTKYPLIIKDDPTQILMADQTTWNNLIIQETTWDDLYDNNNINNKGTKWDTLLYGKFAAFITDKEIYEFLQKVIQKDTCIQIFKDADEENQAINASDDTKASINTIYLDSDKELMFYNIYNLKFGKNIILEVTYRYREQIYGFEENNTLIQEAKAIYKNAYQSEYDNGLLPGYPDNTEDDIIWNARNKTAILYKCYKQYIGNIGYAYGLIKNLVSAKSAPSNETYIDDEEE